MVKPLVTVLMPVRNGEKYLTEAIDSIKRQSLEDFEFVIVDDGSTDGTAAILEQAAKDDPRILILKCASVGIAGALEAGRSVARAPYIARMDADDMALPLRLALQVEYLDAHPSVVALGGQIRIMNEQGTTLSRGRFPVEPLACRAYLSFGAPHCHPTVMMRRDALQKVGGYRRIFEPAEDLDLWLRLSRVGELANLREEVLHYRRHSAAVTTRRVVANARAAVMARLSYTHGETVLPRNWQEQHSANVEWSVIEAQMPAHLRLTARADYLQALTLNGGITEPKAWAFLRSSMPELARWARNEERSDKFGFMIVRAAHQYARTTEPWRALLAIGLGLKYAPVATCQEALVSFRAWVAGKHASRASS